MQWDLTKCILCLDCMNVCPAECITFPADTYTLDKENPGGAVEAVALGTSHYELVEIE